VRNLGDGYEEHKRFFEIFGTHYPVSTLYGGLRYTQQYVKSEEAASRLQKGWKAGYEKKAQVYGVEVAASLGFSETTTNESASGSSVDTSGTISYGTLAPGSQTSMEPIKVHLEPIVELILPTLFAATSAGEVEAVNQKRTAMRSHLDVYLTPSAGTVASRSPRVFEMKVTSVTLIDEDDDFTGPAPELYQSIYIIGRKQEAAAAKEISSANAWSKTAGERVPLEKNQKLSLKEHVARTVVFPKAVKRADGGWDADYELAKYDFQIHVNLYEHDNTATDYITGNRTVKVTELAAKGVLAGSPMEGSFDVSGDGAGTVRVKYQLQEAPFDKVQNPPLSLPSYPDYVP
jgi:hypothetical protein